MTVPVPAATLVALTLVVPDPPRLADLYASHFGWAVTAERSLNLPAGTLLSDEHAAARALVIDTGGVELRVVSGAGPVPAPYTTLGWAGIEIQTQDVDALVASLPEPHFTKLAEPSELSVSPDVRFCPVHGPAGELLLLTTVRNHAFGVAPASRPVDRPFLITCGTHDIEDELGAWSRLGLVGSPMQAAMPGLSAVHDLPVDTRHPLTLLTLSGPGFLEIGRYPGSARHRSRLPGQLPPGLAIVTLARSGWEPAITELPSGALLETVPA